MTPNLETSLEIDSAKKAIVAALNFATTAMQAFVKAHPEQADALTQSGCPFSVLETDILSKTPTITLVANFPTGAVQIASTELTRIKDTLENLH